MKKIFLYCFDKWWILPLFSAMLFALFFFFDEIWLLLAGFLFITASVIYQLINKRWKLGCLTGAIMIVYLCLSIVWFILQFIFPNENIIHHRYAKRYENRKEIQNIIGVEIPKFKVVDSRLIYMHGIDFEFEVQSKIEFETFPDDNLFGELDSICRLQVPQEPNKSSSFFYYSLECIGRCWEKNGNEYKYSRETDFGEKFLHSTDAYFYFTITKGSKTAKIRYGNY
ncbi:MAG: hypothetical protein WCI92_00355 [Bacteroidota bacterium]